MEQVQAAIKRVEAEIKYFWRHRSQSDPTTRSDFKELQSELDLYKKLLEKLKQEAELQTENAS